jgi:hypothetical protein
MNIAFVLVTAITAIATAAIVVADFIPAGFVLTNSAEVGVPRFGYRRWGRQSSAAPAGSLSGCWACRRWGSPLRPAWSATSSVQS